MDNHGEVKVGELDKNMESGRVVTDFPEAVIREGACEPKKKVCCAPSLTPRMWKTADGRRAPLVDEDWHAICQATFQGVEGAAGNALYSAYKELHNAVTCKKSGEKTRMARHFWTWKEAKDK